MSIDHDCELCKKGIPECDKCNVELKKGEYAKTDEGIEVTEFICPQCKNKKLDIKMPRWMVDKDVFAE